MTKLSATLFRFRVFVIAGLFFLGFWSPWDAWFGWQTARVWLVVPQQISRLGWLSLSSATLTLTIAAVACAIIGAIFRTCGTAFLHAGVVYDDHMHAEQIVADGPFRYVRNPLYLGTLFHVLALGMLMSVSGALFVIVLVKLFHLALVYGEERLMLAQRGEQYAKYMKAVPRWVPALRPKVPSSGAMPQWGQAIVGEMYVIGVAALYLALAWRYNAQLLERGILIAFGARLVVRAGSPWNKSATK